MPENSCQLIFVAGSRACEVWLCEDCGTVHLGIDPVSLRLKLTHFIKVVETLQDAVNQVRIIRKNSGRNLFGSREKQVH